MATTVLAAHVFYVFVALATTYYVVGYRLTAVAFRHHCRVDPRPGHRYDQPNFTDLYGPENFRPEGQAARRRALHWWWGGGAVLVGFLTINALIGG